MNVNLKVSFYLKRERKTEKTIVDDNSVYPIVGKIIIGRSIAQFSTKLKVSENLWHVKSGRAIGKSKAATELNREINKANLLIHSRYAEILKRNGSATATEVKNAFQGVASSQKTLLAFFEEVIQDFYLRVGIDRAKASYFGYVNTHKHLQRFIKAKYNVRDIPLTQLDLSFIENFDFYLRIERRLMPKSVNGRIINLLTVTRVALYCNLISNPPFFGYKLERPAFQIRSLSKEEFERIISTEIQAPNLCFVRDMFLFASFTGISYIDLKNLTQKEIITEEDGSLWISKSRQKTGIPFNVKLLDIPAQIIEKYKEFSKNNLVFDIPYLQKVNTLLKEVAKLCGIKRTLTFHISRHTFATQVCLSQGVPIESVSRMLGHTDIATTQRYAHVNREKIGNDMKLLAARLESKFDYSTC
jgi:integrase